MDTPMSKAPNPGRLLFIACALLVSTVVPAEVSAVDLSTADAAKLENLLSRPSPVFPGSDEILSLPTAPNAYPGGRVPEQAPVGQPYEPARDIWLTIKDLGDPKIYLDFARRFPDSEYAKQALALAGGAPGTTAPGGGSGVIREPSTSTAPPPPAGYVAMQGACLLNSLSQKAPYEMKWSGEPGYRIIVDPGSYWCHWRPIGGQTLTVGYKGRDRNVTLGRVNCEAIDRCTAMREFARYRLEPFGPVKSASELVGYPSGSTETLPSEGTVAMQGACFRNGNANPLQYEAWWSGEKSFTITVQPGYTQCHWRPQGDQVLTLRYNGAQKQMPLARVLCESINECSGSHRFPQHPL